MADRLKDKVALVVGAGSIGPGWGNGKATAVAFAREGAKVFCVDINLAAAEETANIITSEGGLALPFRADVTKSDDVEAMVKACIADFGRIDVLDNNVGIAEVGGVVELPEEHVGPRLAVNLKSAFLTMKHVIPLMVVQGGGSIINISSVAGDPLHRRALCDLLRLEGRAQPSDAHHRGRICEQARARERDPARADADADGRALGRPRASPMRAATSRRCGACAPRRCRWASAARPGTSRGRRSISRATRAHTSPASSWWSMAGCRKQLRTVIPEAAKRLSGIHNHDRCVS